MRLQDIAIVTNSPLDTDVVLLEKFKAHDRIQYDPKTDLYSYRVGPASSRSTLRAEPSEARLQLSQQSRASNGDTTPNSKRWRHSRPRTERVLEGSPAGNRRARKGGRSPRHSHRQGWSTQNGVLERNQT